jgi:caa(3)-type oxidase subunit IV
MSNPPSPVGQVAPSHGHAAPSRKMYMVVFAVLTVLTVVEVLVAGASLLSRVSLVALALIKAGFVGWFFMHLNHEMKALKYTVVLPFFFPALYAFVLIAEAVWRLTT